MLTELATRLLFRQTLNLHDRVLEFTDCGISRYAAEICGNVLTVQSSETKARRLANSNIWPHIVHDPNGTCDINELIRDFEPTYLVTHRTQTPEDFGGITKILAPTGQTGFTVERGLFGMKFMTRH